MLIKKAFKFRLYPNKEQQENLSIQFGQARFVYNYMLGQRIEIYKAKGETLNYHHNALMLTKMKKDDAYSWLKEGHSQVLQQSLKDLDRAYLNFFSKRAAFPKFKSKRNKQSIRYPQGIKVDREKRQTYLPKIGWVKTVYHRELIGEIRNVTVSKTASGKYFAAFQVQYEKDEPIYQGRCIGIDAGIHSFITTSDGLKIENPKWLRESENRLIHLQKQLSRKQKGSNTWHKQRIKVAKQHEKIQNQRSDFLHKLSHKIVQENQLIAIEDLNLKGMMKDKHLAKSIGDLSWYEFSRQLEYKGAWYGCEIIKIDRWYPSSKTCSECGHVVETMPLYKRKWTCTNCQKLHDRDINAAKNILNQATVGTTECWPNGRNADGVEIRPAFTWGTDVEVGSPLL
jgi:putative transposase